jgi:transposase, IS30 family
LSYAAIGRMIGRPTSTVTRELDLHRKDERRPRAEPRGRETPRPGFKRQRLNYSPSVAQDRADAAKARPKIAKLAANPRLRAEVEASLKHNHSPEQISARLVVDFPDDPEMRVSHETIYQALYVQGKGALNRELTRHLRTGRGFGSRAANRRSGCTGLKTWFRSANDRPRLKIGPCPAIGRAI